MQGMAQEWAPPPSVYIALRAHLSGIGHSRNASWLAEGGLVGKVQDRWKKQQVVSEPHRMLHILCQRMRSRECSWSIANDLQQRAAEEAAASLELGRSPPAF
mmetsp:Transcript_123139/g.213623  ORF Transcript_123139/g.213623 Transcript_123139/m.213623 type:complete len:102 (-) Transcript_123139:156-461(-)